MIMGDINDCKLFKLWTLYYSLGSHTSQASKSPYWWRRSLSWRFKAKHKISFDNFYIIISQGTLPLQ
jgi:hypothetical protein